MRTVQARGPEKGGGRGLEMEIAFSSEKMDVVGMLSWGKSRAVETGIT